MSDFVQQCRREWERLGVPDPIANEMAADLAADLAEAQADGVSGEELLGPAIFDPRSFAATWAGERGVIPAAPGTHLSLRTSVLVVALATFAVTVLVGAALIATRLHTTAVAVRANGAFERLSVPPGLGGHQLPLAAQALPWILVFGIACLAATAAAWLCSKRLRRPTTPFG